MASLIGLRQATRFEGQAAMELEFAIEYPETAGHYPVAWMEPPPACGKAASPALLDWQPLIEAIVSDSQDKVPTGIDSLEVP